MQEVKRPATATTSKISEPVKTNVVKERPLSSGVSDRKATQPTQTVHCLLYTSQLNELEFMYRQLSSDMQEEYVSLLTVYENLEMCIRDRMWTGM